MLKKIKSRRKAWQQFKMLIKSNKIKRKRDYATRTNKAKILNDELASKTEGGKADHLI